MTNPRNQTNRNVAAGWRLFALLAFALGAFCSVALAQTDCYESNDAVDTTAPKDLTPQDLIRKFTAQEDKVKAARSHYTFTQDVLVQTLDDKVVDGQYHQVLTVSYDEKGRRQEHVTFAEQPTLRGVSLTEEDMDDIRTFMPWILTSDQAPEYDLTYSGKQHVDDLDTYVFHVAPKKQEKDKRYFSGRIWVDNRDFEIVKLCGKTVPEQFHPKKHEPVNVRPSFVGYRQLVDGYWFPAYARVDDTLHFRAQSVHIREIVKLTNYKRVDAAGPDTKP